MWTLNRHNLSRVFTGSRALEGKAKVKENLRLTYFLEIGSVNETCSANPFVIQVGKFKDGARSVSRTIQSNFFDGVKQEAIDLLLLGDFYNDECADKDRMLMDNSALLGKQDAEMSAC